MKIFKCPKCEAPRKVKDHCESKTCFWVKCQGCGVTVDPETGRWFEKQ